MFIYFSNCHNNIVVYLHHTVIQSDLQKQHREGAYKNGQDAALRKLSLKTEPDIDTIATAALLHPPRRS